MLYGYVDIFTLISINSSFIIGTHFLESKMNKFNLKQFKNQKTMEIINEYLVVKKQSPDGEDKTYGEEGKNMWIPFGKISWASIFAGVLVTTVTQMLLSLLGLGIGLGTVDPLSESDPAAGLGIGSITWWSVSMLIALFLGGLTTGKMYRTKSKVYLTWHGLLTWCTFTVFSFFMLTTSIGKLVSGTGNIISTVVTAGAAGATQLDISGITRDANNFLMGTNQTTTTNRGTRVDNNQNGTNTGQNSNTRTPAVSSQQSGSVTNQNIQEDVQQGTGASNNQSVVDEVQTFFKGGNVQGPEARESLINTIVSQTDMTRAEATNKVDKWISSYENLKENARVAADKAAQAISTASIIGFFALIIGALVTIWGARMAFPKENINVNKTERSLR